MKRTWYVLSTLALVGPMLTQATVAQDFDVSWSTIDGGGGTSAGGPFILRGTIGQPDAGGPQMGGAFELTGGFWPPTESPIECVAPVVVGAGSRVLSITPGGEALQALRVIGLGAAVDVGCVDIWVQANGSLGVDPVFLTPTEWTSVNDTIPGNGQVEASGLAIVPGATYSVLADCTGTTSPGSSATTYSFGDVSGNGITNLDDTLLIVLGIEGNPPDGVTVAEMDIEPCVPNKVVNLADALVTVLTIEGTTYTDLCGAICP